MAKKCMIFLSSHQLVLHNLRFLFIFLTPISRKYLSTKSTSKELFLRTRDEYFKHNLLINLSYYFLIIKAKKAILKEQDEILI